MQSGVGDQSQLQQCGIPVAQHLPGVGQNHQAHPRFDHVWEFVEPDPSLSKSLETVCFWQSDLSTGTPDVQIAQVNSPDIRALHNGRQPAGTLLATGERAGALLCS